MTMTRTRRKQKQEMVKRAVREAEERQSELRQQFPLLTTAIVQQAAYEPALFYHPAVIQQQQQSAAAAAAAAAEAFGDDGEAVPGSGNPQAAGAGGIGAGGTTTSIARQPQQMPVSQPLFPSSILSVVPLIIELFDDVQIDQNGASGKRLRGVNFN